MDLDLLDDMSTDDLKAITDHAAAILDRRATLDTAPAQIEALTRDYLAAGGDPAGIHTTTGPSPAAVLTAAPAAHVKEVP